MDRDHCVASAPQDAGENVSHSDAPVPAPAAVYSQDNVISGAVERFLNSLFGGTQPVREGPVLHQPVDDVRVSSDMRCQGVVALPGVRVPEFSDVETNDPASYPFKPYEFTHGFVLDRGVAPVCLLGDASRRWLV